MKNILVIGAAGQIGSESTSSTVRGSSPSFVAIA